MTLYKGFDLFLIRPNWLGDPEHGYSRAYELLSYLGLEYSESQVIETATRLKALYTEFDRSALQTLLNFFDGKKGRWYPFWMPSFSEDLVVTAAFGSDATTLTIEDVDYPNYWLPNDATGRHLYIEWPDGSYVCKAVTDAAGSTLTLEEAIGKAATTADLPGLRVSFLYFVRFDLDEVEIEYITPEIADIQLSFKTVPAEAPEIS